MTVVFRTLSSLFALLLLLCPDCEDMCLFLAFEPMEDASSVTLCFCSTFRSFFVPLVPRAPKTPLAGVLVFVMLLLTILSPFGPLDSHPNGAVWGIRSHPPPRYNHASFPPDPPPRVSLSAAWPYQTDIFVNSCTPPMSTCARWPAPGHLL